MDFSTASDDFFVNMDIHTTLALPKGRETILHFCEAVQKEFPEMSGFYQRDSGEFVLEGNRDSGNYSWLELQARRLSAGCFNPSSIQAAYCLHRWLLERSVYYLGISPLDVECLDVTFGFNLDYQGNRDAIVAQALLSGSPLWAITAERDARAVECEPAIVFALDEDCSLQARISLETRCSSYQIRTGNYDNEPISVYLAIRRYPRDRQQLNSPASFDKQAGLCEDLAGRIIVPQVVRPIAAAIASAR